MNFAFDLDDTLVNLIEPIQKLCKKNNFKYCPPKDWEMTNYPDMLRFKIFKMFEQNDIMCSLKPHYFSKTIINRLKKLGKVIIITARFKNIEKQTIRYAEKLFNVPVFVVNPNSSKLDIMKKEKIDIFIDDSPNKILEYENNGIKCIMISNKHTLYNHHVRDKVVWFDDLKKVYKYIIKNYHNPNVSL